MQHLQPIFSISYGPWHLRCIVGEFDKSFSTTLPQVFFSLSGSYTFYFLFTRLIFVQRICDVNVTCVCVCVLQHNLCCDNCHSHVAYALSLMKYDGSTSWNMITLCFLMLFHSRYVRYSCNLKYYPLLASESWHKWSDAPFLSSLAVDEARTILFFYSLKSVLWVLCLCPSSRLGLRHYVLELSFHLYVCPCTWAEALWTGLPSTFSFQCFDTVG